MGQTFKLSQKFLDKPINVAVVGAGGTGSAIVAGLISMSYAMRELGGVRLNVTIFDDDEVSPANIARQAFSPADVGRKKSTVLADRANLCLGMTFKAQVKRLEVADTGYDLYIGCVDSRKSRAIIRKLASPSHGETWWLDCGNTARSGQAILGVVRNGQVVLPSAADLFPDIVDESLDADDTAPSCSLPEALRKQDLFINRKIAIAAIDLLWSLFRYGEVDVHGCFVNSQTHRQQPMDIDPKVWERFGFVMPKPESESNESPVKTTKKRARREAVAA